MTSDEQKKLKKPKVEDSFSIQRAKSAAWAIIALRPLRTAVGAVALLVLVRNIDEAHYGAYQIYYSIIAFLSMAVSLGISNTIARYLPEYIKTGQSGLANRFVQLAARMRLLSNVLMLTIVWIFWEPLTSLLNIEDYADSYFVFCAVALTYFQTSLLVTVLSSYLLQRRSLLVQTMFPAVKTVGYLAVLNYGLNVTTALAVDLIAYVLMWVGLRIIYHKETPASQGTVAFPPVEAKRVLRYSLFYNFNDMGQFAVGKRIDNFFIASMMNVTSVGAYSLAVRILEIVRGFVPDKFFLDVIRPLFFTLNLHEDAGRVTHYFQLLVKFNYVVFAPVTAVVIVAHSEILDVAFGGKFLEYSVLLAWVFAFAALTAFDKPLRLVVQLREKAATIFFSKLFGIYNVIALLVLIPPFGLVGAAIATGTTDILVKLFLWWFVREHASFVGMGRFFAISLVVWSLYCATAFPVLALIDSPFWHLSCALIMALFWWLLYLRLRLLSSEEMATICEVLHKRNRVWLVRLGLLQEKGVSNPGRG